MPLVEISDYIVERLASAGITDAFMATAYGIPYRTVEITAK